MAELSHVGMTCDCPHCYAQFQVPDMSSVVDKDKFVEPQGLRRVLKQVRDQEWEMLRRKLRAAKAHTAELEAELHRAQAALAAAKPSEEKGGEVESLRKQLSELGEQFAQANQAFSAGRKQQNTVIELLRRELSVAREEAATFKKKNEELARLMQVAREENAKSRGKKSGELDHEIERLREELAETQSKLEVEQAKVLVMEAAGVSPDVPMVGEANAGGDARMRELESQVAELRKSNDSLRAARDKVHAELTALKERSATSTDENQQLETALGNLEESLAEVLERLTARRAEGQKPA